MLSVLKRQNRLHLFWERVSSEGLLSVYETQGVVRDLFGGGGGCTRDLLSAYCTYTVRLASQISGPRISYDDLLRPLRILSGLMWNNS